MSTLQLRHLPLLFIFCIIGSFAHASLVFEKYKQSINADGTKDIVVWFPFSNTGISTIKIVSVKFPCPCDKFTLSKKELNPGDKAELSIPVKAVHTGGEYSKQAVIETDELINNIYILDLTVLFKKTIAFFPKSISFGNTSKTPRKAELHEVKVILANNGTAPISIEDSEAIGSNIAFKMIPKVVGYRFEFTVRSKMLGSSSNGFLLVKYKGSDDIEQSIWLRVN